MIRLIATDIDGTLIEDGGHLLPGEYLPVLEALLERGVVFTGASGRQLASIQKLFEPLSPRLCYIAEGGGCVYVGGELLQSFAMEESMVRALLADAQKLEECEVMLCTTQNTYVRSGQSALYRWLVEGYHFEVKVNPDFALSPDEEVVKLSIYHPSRTEEIVSEWFLPKWKERVQIASAGVQWMDCVSTCANKGNALAALQKHLGISPQETMVFGDNINDLPMLRQAKFSYAVESARPECKQAAAFLCPGWRENGVLRTLQKTFSL